MSDVSSPRTQSSQFDALIDLLATDDAADPLSDIPPSASGGLRDAQGNLDFAKVRTFFAGRAVDQRASPETNAHTNALSGNDMKSVSLVSVFVEGSHEVQVDVLSKISHSPSPAGSPPPPSPDAHVGETEPYLDDELRQHTGRDMDPPSSLHPRYFNSYDKPDRASPRRGELPIEGHAGMPDAVSFGISHASRNRCLLMRVRDKREPIAATVDELDRALSLAQKEVTELRSRTRELHSTITKDLAPRHTKSPNTSIEGFNGAPNDSESRHDDVDDLPPAIQALSGDQARRLLAEVIRTLSLPLNAPAFTGRLADVRRAQDFLTQTDELVWRRSRSRAGAATAPGPASSAQNITALAQRLALWERVIRNPIPQMPR
ncbi:hypothetical protein EVG20_g5002 [Dentipellis fragilis]|uniref:Uncharacterized protein n=1 Tax=Dentipellis fragilis TaxID=205917 RepID=A0A4Y9YWY3_9AGAM|nr:hypothetical protein EVG20_g5002 [Dentipellis fragilis]